MTNRVHTIILGGAAAGAAIACELAGRQKQIALLYRAPDEGATYTNQRWLHSGLLYPGPTRAAKVWRQFTEDWHQKADFITGYEYDKKRENPDLLTAHFLFRDPEAFRQRMANLTEWKKKGHRIAPFEVLRSDEIAQLNETGLRCVAGFSAPDCTVDFPALAEKLRKDVEVKGGIVRKGTALKLRYEKNVVLGVDYRDLNGNESAVDADNCVVAMGAWSYGFLKDSTGLRLPMMRKKCVVLVYETELIDRITCWCDVQRDDDSSTDVTLVPFYGKTLGAGTDFKVVYGANPVRAGAFEVAALKADLTQGFPKLTGGEPRVCIKSEHYNPDHPDIGHKIYCEKASPDGWDHGIRGLVIALPGKASLMFDLARQVADRLS